MDTEIKKVNFSEFEHWLNKSNDTVYVINFWATWCKPCIEELPALEKVNENYKNNKVKVLLVSLDFPGHLETRVIPFLKKQQIESEVLLLDDPNSNAWINKVNPEWSGAIPATIIYNYKERLFKEGIVNYEYLDEKIQSLIINN